MQVVIGRGSKGKGKGSDSLKGREGREGSKRFSRLEQVFEVKTSF
jgi:hypothetical protein